MRADVNIGERVADMLNGIDAFYRISQATPLAEMIGARNFETRQRLAALASRRGTAQHSTAQHSTAQHSTAQ